MRFQDEHLSNVLHAVAAIPFGFTMLAFVLQVLQYAA